MKKLELNKEQRNSIYKDVFLTYAKKRSYESLGICWYLYKAILNRFGVHLEYEVILNILPEFAAERPINTKPDSYWWKLDDKAPRLKALKNMIAKTN